MKIKHKRLLWLILGIYFLIMEIMLWVWFGFYGWWQLFFLFIAAAYCISKSNILFAAWDYLFPDVKDEKS